MSAAMLQQFGFVGLSVLTAGQTQMTQNILLTSFGVGSDLFGTLPFSRQHELEADHLGTILMAIAGNNPNEGPIFWERMSNIPGGRVPEFLSTHPSDEERMRQLRNVIPEAVETAERFGVHFS
jgi:predicted Zn-dependent protease